MVFIAYRTLVMVKYISIILCILTPAIVLSGTIDPKNSDEQHIELAQQPVFDCVLPLVSKKEGKITSLSSCVLINTNYALTAAHIFSTIPDGHTFFIVADDKLHLVSEVICHKFFKPTRLGFYDIALCKLDSNITSIKFPELYHKKTELLKKSYICGYGITGNFDTGAKISDGKKRAGTNLVESIKNHVLICSPSHSPGSNLEFLISHGDSGGGLFIDGKLAGINSYVASHDGEPDSSWKDEAGHTRISLFLDWISQHTK